MTLFPSSQEIYDATLIFGLVHGFYWSIGPGRKRIIKKLAKSERLAAIREHYNPHFHHKGKNPRVCTDGKCAML